MIRLQSLRQQVVLLFALLAVGPLLALGITDYVRARRAVEGIVRSQTAAGARQAAALITERLSIVQSDALLLSDNEETQRLFDPQVAADSTRRLAAYAAAEAFLRTAWPQLERSYRAVELTNSLGSIALSARADTVSSATRRDDGRLRQALARFDDAPTLTYPILHRESGLTVGQVVFHPNVPTIIPDPLRELRFGRSGYVRIVDHSTARVLFSTQRSQFAGRVDPTVSAADTVAPAVLRYTEGDSTRLASVVAVPGTTWLVVSSAALNEFTTGLNQSRLRDLSLVVVAAAFAALLFTVLLGRATRSLDELTVAARAVAQGDLAPQLPPAPDNEIGTLVGAFEHMLTRLRHTLREIEVSRQLAVVGEFSAQLAHEIRNPLTAIKLNLQELSREARNGRLPDTAIVPLDTSLNEVKRLDGVVRGVLTLARADEFAHHLLCLDTLLREVFELHSRQLQDQRIVVESHYDAERYHVLGDDSQLRSIFSNLVVNAIDAQPQGGRIVVTTRNINATIHVTVADDGPGVAPVLADRIFSPFVSGSPTGTGIGLSLALKFARDHHGTLGHVDSDASVRGATFRVVLPLTEVRA